MSGAVNAQMPCDGDAYHDGREMFRFHDSRDCDNCAQGTALYFGKGTCAGSDGWKLFGPTAIEVARERAARNRKLEARTRDLEWRMDAHAITAAQLKRYIGAREAGGMTPEREQEIIAHRFERELVAERERNVKLERALRWYAIVEPIELHTNDEIEEYQRRAKEALAALEGTP